MTFGSHQWSASASSRLGVPDQLMNTFMHGPQGCGNRLDATGTRASSVGAYQRLVGFPTLLAPITLDARPESSVGTGEPATSSPGGEGVQRTEDLGGLPQDGSALSTDLRQRPGVDQAIDGLHRIGVVDADLSYDDGRVDDRLAKDEVAACAMASTMGAGSPDR